VADGVNITDGGFGGIGVYSRMLGSLSTGINLSFVEEVQVKTGGFEAQYGKSTGGIVQIVTKSGGSTFHGSIGGYFAPQSLTITTYNSTIGKRILAHWVPAGLLYGIFVYYFMQMVVHLSHFPVSDAPKPLWRVLGSIIGHALLVGLPIAGATDITRTRGILLPQSRDEQDRFFFNAFSV